MWQAGGSCTLIPFVTSLKLQDDPNDPLDESMWARAFSLLSDLSSVTSLKLGDFMRPSSTWMLSAKNFLERLPHFSNLILRSIEFDSLSQLLDIVAICS
jgi:hypothetical protein